jgi:DNA-binding GntR family transcriptional regulator
MKKRISIRKPDATVRAIMKLSSSLKIDYSLSEIVFQSIYKKIVSGQVAPGDRITEASISGSMGISRSPVREAIKRLAEINLVVLVPRSGCFVAEVKPEEVKEICEIRKRLECMALEYAWGNFSLPRIKSLKNRFERHADIHEPAMLKKEIQLDSLLHRLILKKSGCRNVQILLEKIQAKIEVYRVRLAQDYVRASQATKEHIEILNAILTDNKEEALRILSSHIENTSQDILSKLT